MLNENVKIINNIYEGSLENLNIFLDETSLSLYILSENLV